LRKKILDLQYSREFASIGGSKGVDMDKPQKADLKSLDVADDKRRQLAQLFPEAVTEVRDEPRMDANGREVGGEYRYAVDYERLKGVLGEFSEILENQRERYGMAWPGKNECLKIIQQPSIATLKPCREESVDFDETENLFIEGDNLEALKLLQKAYYGKVKMIYIDPPYNTGQEFIYPDDYSETLDTYLAYTGQVDADGRKFATNTEAEGRYHSKWLSMMFPRLYLARNLLREDGLIFISIDHNELTSLRCVCDSIFGEENFVECVTWKKRYGAGGGSKGFARLHEYILVYSKSQIESVEAPLSEDQIEAYKGRDEKYDQRGGFVTQPLATSSKGERANLMYEIEHEGKKITPKPGSRWLWSKPKFDEAYANDEIVINEGTDGFSVRFKQYLKDENGQMRNGKPLSIKSDVFNQEGTKEVAELLGDRGIFEFPKPSRLLEYFFSFIINDQRDDDGIYLDFFAGSASSAHAVLDLNARDSRRRRFIMVQLPEPCDEASDAFSHGYKTIADIGKERIRRVLAAVQKDRDGELDLEGKQQEVLGFRVFKLERSNFRLWDGSQPGEDPEKIAKQLELHEQHIDPNATQEDILYELLLKAGFPLTTKVEKVEMAGKEVFSIAEGALLICLQDEITKELIKAMADADPLQVICLDSGFKNNDQLKANAVQTFKARNKGAETATVFRTV